MHNFTAPDEFRERANLELCDQTLAVSAVQIVFELAVTERCDVHQNDNAP